MADIDKLKFAQLLQECPCLATLAGREQVIGELKLPVPRSQPATALQEATAIAATVLNYPDGIVRLLQIIRHYDGETIQTTALTEFLQKSGHLSSETAKKATTKHNLPFAARDPKFTGRETELANLRRTLLADGAAALVVARGQGGVGKTSLAREYAFRHLSGYTTVGWLDSETQTSLMTSFSRLAKLLNLPEVTVREEEVIRAAVLEHLTATDGWLLIYDNAEDERELQKWLPMPCTGHVLITSRTQRWDNAQPLTVPLLPEEECLALLLRWLERPHWQNPAEQAAATELCRELGYLTLAVAQAGAFIKNTGMSLAEYLPVFREMRLAVFEESDAQLADRPDEGNVAATYRLNVEKLEKANPAARDLLNLLAFFAPEPFRLELLKEAADKLPESLATTVKSSFLLGKATAELRRYSLATVEDGKITLHRLVGLVIRDRHLNAAGHEIWASAAAMVMWALYPTGWKYENSQRCQELLEHALAAADYAFALEVGLEAVSYLSFAAGGYLQQRANYPAALPLLQRALAIDEQVYGPNHPEVASSLASLAGVLQAMGDYNAALPLLQRALAIHEQVHGANHPDVATNLNNLASVLKDMGDYNSALPLFQRALAIYEQVHGANHPDVATSLNNLGLLLKDMGDYNAALPLFQRALAIYEKELGPNHPYVANSLASLASVLKVMGDYNAALPLFQRALAIYEKELGANHPYVATNLNNLASVLQAMGDYNAALPLFQRALAIREKELGPNHPDVATSLASLASVLKVMGDYNAALPLFQRALAIYEKELGANHPDVATSLNNLGLLLKVMGDYNSALPLFQRALAIREKELGPNHPDVATSLLNMGAFLYEQGELATARAHLEQALAIYRNVLGDEHPHTKLTLSWLEAVRRAQGEIT
jgi:tetratricopeptide (TPR) repeat protein